MKRRVISFVMCIVMMLGLISAASAQFIQSGERTFSLNGRTYKGWAELDVNSSGFKGYTHIRKSSGENVKDGNMIAIAELYNKSGKLIGSQPEPNYGTQMASAETVRVTSVSDVYCKGTVGILVLETSNFVYFTVGPTASVPMPYSEPEPFKVNSHGNTYGTALYATEMEEIPDLISAVGVYGTEGFVKKDDLYPTHYVQKSAQEQEGNVTWIPLYDSEERQIGLYELGTPALACENDPEYQAKLDEISKDWSVNSLGMTYAFDGVCTGGYIFEPTLVAAVGRDKDGNQVEGYIQSRGAYTDTVEDLLNWTKTVKELSIPFFIAPLYNSEFEQIGGFRIGGTVPVEGAEQEAFWATYFASLEG